MSTFAHLASLADLLKLNACWVTFQQLQDIESYFGSIEQAMNESQQAWLHADILRKSQHKKFFSDNIQAEVDVALEWSNHQGQGWIGFDDKRYPEKLSQIDDRPILLGYRGDSQLLSDPQLAVVGSRHASKSGVEIAKDFSSFLSKQGVTITSGLAQGIDTAAHVGGLQGLGKTVAVVATGLDRIYPASNKVLGHEIVEQGVMISEFPLGTKPVQYNFPKRNRIISGLSLGTLVVEAALKSGSLITARTAMEQGREVFAVPGSINNPQAKGCHQLIKQGAKLVETGADVLQEVSAHLQSSIGRSMADQLNLGQEASKSTNSHPLLEYIGYDPIGLDELVVLSKMPVSNLQGELMMLVLSGDIEAMSAARWRRI